MLIRIASVLSLSLSLFVIQFLTLVTLRCAGQEGLYVFRGGTVLKLGIICIEMMLKRVGFDDCRQGRGVKSEENSAKDRSLWDATG